MIATSINESLVNGYWNSIKNAPSEIKLKLISLLTESLVDYIANDKKTKEEATLKHLNEISGSWEGPETAEQIIDIIREKRTSRSPISL